MPEGPEIRRAADRIASAIEGEVVDEVFFAFDALKPWQSALRGKRVRVVEPRGKALLIRFEDGPTMYSHNQLYGRWFIRERGVLPRTRRQLRAAIHTERTSALLYSASEIDVLTPAQIATHPFLASLGPDVVSDGVGMVLAQIRAERFRRRRLASLLLDQGFLAGVGNYLRSEILFVAGLHPQRRPMDCSDAELEALADAAVTLAQRAYRHNGVTNDLQIARRLKAEGQPRSRYRHWVFARADRA